MTKSHCSTQQTLLKSDVKNKDVSNILVKMKEKTCTFQNILIKSLISREKYCCWMNSSCSEVFKTVPDVIFIMSGAQLIWIFVICFLVKACKLKYSWFWHLTFRWLCWALHWLLIKVSFRYQNRPCLGREWVIGHQYLRRFRSNNRVLQNNAIYGRPCMTSSQNW